MGSRDGLRSVAKKIYKEQIKKQGIPKKQRMPFSAFYKQFVKQHKAMKNQTTEEAKPNTDEDFDFSDMVNVNEITDDDVDNSEEE